jgi:hypothetical protein
VPYTERILGKIKNNVITKQQFLIPAMVKIGTDGKQRMVTVKLTCSMRAQYVLQLHIRDIVVSNLGLKSLSSGI